MKVLVIGGGGREHALAWKLAQSSNVEIVFVAPGNAGTAREPDVCNIPIDADDLRGLRDFAQNEAVDLTVVGPEAPLVDGVVDMFRDAGLRCFGPCREAARLEASKSFAKAFLARHGIPTADYAAFSEVEPAVEYLRAKGAPIVVKADGLAAGKGVILAHSLAEAEAAVTDMLAGNVFGEAGHRVVIEEFLRGEEASFIVMCDGRNILPMASSQDHKAREDGDRGPNTGGMGACSPAPVITPDIHDQIISQVIRPTLNGMAADGHPYTGFLYAGLMISPDGSSKVLEFNCRFGDPETQPILMRLRSDLAELCNAAIDGRLDRVSAEWDPQPSLGVVMVADGYPGSYRKGDVIAGLGLDNGQDLKVFHAGTAEQDGSVVTSGGRVLCVTALGDSVRDAKERAYEGVAQIDWAGASCRGDIGFQAIARERSGPGNRT